MIDTEKIALIRKAMPVTQSKVYLNAGLIGPLSTVVIEALEQANQFDFIESRSSAKGRERYNKAVGELRQALATMVNGTSAEIALTHHTTDGMNMVAHGFNWRPGDEVITTDLEHPGGLLPFYLIRQRYGVVVNVVKIPVEASADEIVERFEAAITPRTRLLAFSHVAWNTGVRLPLPEIAAMGHRHHVLNAVDAAQSAGSIPLDLPASGVDFYAMPAQKWLCGPEGMGALYVRYEHLSRLEPTIVGSRSMGDDGGYNLTGHFMVSSDARRYENGTVYRPGVHAMLAGMKWMGETIGWPWIYARIAHLAQYAHDRLSHVEGVTVITPPMPHAGLITFSLEGHASGELVAKLAEKNIVLRAIAEPSALRISTGFYNTETDIDRLISALQDILTSAQ